MTLIAPGLLDPVSGTTFTTSPIRFVSFTLETNVSKDYGTDYRLGFNIANTDSKVTIFSDSPVTWVIPSGATSGDDAPNQPQWHEDAPISGQGSSYAASWISNDGGTDNLTLFDFDQPPITDTYYTISAFPGNRPARLTINPGGVAGTRYNISTYRIRRVSDSVVMAEAQVTLKINFV